MASTRMVPHHVAINLGSPTPVQEALEPRKLSLTHQPNPMLKTKPQDYLVLENQDCPEPICQQFEVLAEQGKSLQREGKYADAIEKLKEALELPMAPYGLVAFAYGTIGRCYDHMQMHDLAIRYHQCEYEVAVSVRDVEMQCSALGNMGIAFTAMANFREAVELHERALHLAVQLNDQRAQLRCYANLGNAHGCAGNFTRAVACHQFQLELARSLRDSASEVRAMTHLEHDYNSLKQYDRAAGLRKQVTPAGKHGGGYASFTTPRVIAETSLYNYASVNETLSPADTSPPTAPRDSHMGWLIKHPGSSMDGPKKLSSGKLWCTLGDGIFAYHENVKTNLRALRYIRMADVMAVEEFHLTPTSGHSSTSFTFRLMTDSRFFYFTAGSLTDSREWLDHLQRARTKIGHFKTVSGGAFGGGLDGKWHSPKTGAMMEALERREAQAYGRGPTSSSVTSRETIIYASAGPKPVSDLHDPVIKARNVANPLFQDDDAPTSPVVVAKAGVQTFLRP